MKNIHFFVFILFLFSTQLSAQLNVSKKASISVITCGPGTELYSTFGHSALRVYDPINGLDKIYNYGTFNFNAPNFYMNFAKGKLTYELSTSSFSWFLRIYQYENRWVKSQVLNLNQTDVQKVFDFLENNAKLENKAYQYDFFYDNCSTKIEEVITTVLGDKVSFSNSHITISKSHRDLIDDYTKNQKWGKFGIDLALGSVIDDNATKDDYKFLPDYIYEAFNNAKIGSDKPLVKSNITFLKEKTTEQAFSLITPFIVFLILSFIIIAITFINYKFNTRSKWLDFTLYFITGFIGVIVLLLWFATSHTATYQNFNFLWAFAPNLIVAFYLLKSKLPKWTFYYNLILLVLIGLMGLLWLIQFQVFNIAILPIIIALTLRYLFLIKTTVK